MVSLIILFSCKDDTSNDFSELKQTISKFYELVEEGNSTERYKLFTTNSLMLSNRGNLTIMTDSIKQAWAQWDEEWIFRIKDVEHVEIEMSGDIAYSVNQYYYTWHHKGSEPEWHKTKNVHIWRKQTDGSWKLRVDIWNSSEG